jgi:hypothetical protein
MGVAQRPLDRPERMFGQLLSQFELLRLALHPLGHGFHQMFVGFRRRNARIEISETGEILSRGFLPR